MATYAAPGAGVPITFYNLPTGLVGTLGVRVMQGETEITARTTAGIVESPPASGVYTATVTAPAIGTYQVTIDDTSGQPSGFASETLIVTASGLPATAGGPTSSGDGPCTLWTTAEDVAACCSVTAAESAFEYAAEVASSILYHLTGRRWSGRCRAVVRPQDLRPDCSPYRWKGSRWPAGCRRVDVITLAGYPVREVEEVTIDGDALDPSEYGLWQGRHLVRLTFGEGWPSCQYLDRPSGEGTFFVTYIYGADPPLAAQHAARALACQVARACAGEACDLPANLSRLVRQGTTVEVDAARALSGPLGVPEVDALLASIPPRRRRPSIHSPDVPPYPLVVSTEPAPITEES